MKNNVRVYEKRIRFVDIAKQFPHGCISQMAFETAFDLPRHYIYTKDMFKQELIVRWGINLQTGENVFPDGTKGTETDEPDSQKPAPGGAASSR